MQNSAMELNVIYECNTVYVPYKQGIN